MSKEIYIKEMPKSCGCCECFAEHRRQCELKLCFQWSEEKMKYNDCPLKSLQDHDKEYEDKIKELQEVDNKRAFRLYSVLYEQLEKEDCENVASRIEYMTSENYADICEMYKTAKNLKQHDRELVKEVCEKIRKELDGDYNQYRINHILDQIQKEFEK